MLTNTKGYMAALLLGALCSVALAGPAEDAAASKKQGDELLAKADFTGALKAYAAAAKADPSNMAYRNEYAILRQVITRRDALAVEKNPEKWLANARALHSYYRSRKINEEALAVDKQLFERRKDADSAIMLADTYLALDKASEAEQVLAGLPADQQGPEVLMIQAIAQARQEKLDQAKQTAGKVKLAADASPGVLYNYACMQARIGDKAGATTTLTSCFEQIPPSRLAGMKDVAKQDRDLASVVGTPEFAAALKVESKVKESSCSGGGNCGSCAKKGGCSSGGGQAGCSDHKEAPAEAK